MTRALAFSALGIVLLSAGCAMDMLHGTGEPEQRVLEVAPFTGIEVDGALDVVVTHGAQQRVVVEAQRELLELVRTDVRKGVWHLSTTRSYSTDKPFIVRIEVPRLDHVTLDGSGDVMADSVFGAGRTTIALMGSGNVLARSLHEERLTVTLGGSGNITLTGTADRMDGTIEGSGNIHALDLAAAHAEVVVQGSGDLELTAIEELDATVGGSGNVRYRGQPKLISRVQGSGTVAPAP
ncbi:MAG: DUF2807 domain-containing protein [Flavobacteriales bacterium]|nr:DUF2807 domain-containing protein [Flavobacteriales bacterium]